MGTWEGNERGDVGTPILEVRNLHKSYKSLDVLRGVSLQVSRGTVTSIIGASGSGKSTLLRCINLLHEPTSGEIIFEGKAVDYRARSRLGINPYLTALRAEVGMVFQDYNLWPHLTVLENVIEAPVRVRGLSRKQAVEKAEHLLNSVGLLDKRDEHPSRLSGGQQQRVAIVRALAMEPKVMLFDEVTSALDPELVGEVLEVMTRLAEEGMTMILVTHEIEFARDVSHHIVFIDRGEIEEQGPPAQVLTNPQSERTRQFLRRILRRNAEDKEVAPRD